MELTRTHRELENSRIEIEFTDMDLSESWPYYVLKSVDVGNQWIVVKKAYGPNAGIERGVPGGQPVVINGNDILSIKSPGYLADFEQTAPPPYYQYTIDRDTNCMDVEEDGTETDTDDAPGPEDYTYVVRNKVDSELSAYDVFLILDGTNKVTMTFSELGNWTPLVTNKVAASMINTGDGFNFHFRNYNGDGPNKFGLDYCEIEEMYLLMKSYFEVTNETPIVDKVQRVD